MNANEHRLHALLGAHDAKFPREAALRFPHVVDRLADLWGTPAIDAYFGELMVADERRKAGFPPEVAMEILSLSFLHDALFPKATAARGVWVEATQRDRTNRSESGTTPNPDKR